MSQQEDVVAHDAGQDDRGGCLQAVSPRPLRRTSSRRTASTPMALSSTTPRMTRTRRRSAELTARSDSRARRLRILSLRARSRQITSRACSTSLISMVTSTWTWRATARSSQSWARPSTSWSAGAGEVLEALQELTRLAVHQHTGNRTRMMLDVGGYRQRRRAELAEAGQDAAEEVRRTGQPKRLWPMNPFERKVVHDAVAAAGLRSESEGEEPERRVVVLPVG